MKILIVDDHPLYIDGLKTTLTIKIKSLEVLEALSVAEALTMIVKHDDIDLVLVDLKLPNLGGIDLLQQLFDRGITTPTLLISGDNNLPEIKKAIDLGACGFIPKSYAANRFIAAVNCVINGGIFIPDEIELELNRLDRQELQSRSGDEASQKVKITPRQMDVLKLMRKGYSNKQISNDLNISVETVKEHVSNLFILLDVDNRVSCIFKAEELGLELH